MSLHVWSADDGEEFVIAETEEDALAVLVKMIGEADVPIAWKQLPIKWERLPDDKPFSKYDDQWNTVTKTCAEWCAELGRGYFCSPNY